MSIYEKYFSYYTICKKFEKIYEMQTLLITIIVITSSIFFNLIFSTFQAYYFDVIDLIFRLY